MQWDRVLDRMRAIPFWQAAGQAAQNREQGSCPECGGELRFYFRIFDKKTGDCALWVWCNHCRVYSSVSNMSANDAYFDPLGDVSRNEFRALERSNGLIAKLDALWDQGQRSHIAEA